MVRHLPRDSERPIADPAANETPEQRPCCHQRNPLFLMSIFTHPLIPSGEGDTILGFVSSAKCIGLVLIRNIGSCFIPSQTNGPSNSVLSIVIGSGSPGFYAVNLPSCTWRQWWGLNLWPSYMQSMCAPPKLQPLLIVTACGSHSFTSSPYSLYRCLPSSGSTDCGS